MNNTPAIVIVRGLPGSGKSFLVEATCNMLPSHSFVVLDPDAVDYEGEEYTRFSESLRADAVDEKLYPYRYLRQKAYGGLLDGKVVVWNQAFTHQDILDRTIKNLVQYGKDHEFENIAVLIVEVAVDPRVARRRLEERKGAGGHVVTEDAMVRFVRDYATFAAYGYEILSIDGSSNIRASAQKLANRILEITKS